MKQVQIQFDIEHLQVKDALRAEATLKRMLHFRYFPQRGATFVDPAEGDKDTTICSGTGTTKITEDYTRSTVVHPNGRFVYSCAGDTFYVKQYRLERNNVLHPLTPSKIGAHSHPGDISLHPNGRFAYVTCSHGAICQYRISPSGQLTPLSPAEVYGSNDPLPLRFDSSGRFACIVSDGPDDTSRIVSVYRVETEGTLTPVSKIPSSDIDVRASSITVHEKYVTTSQGE